MKEIKSKTVLDEETNQFYYEGKSEYTLHKDSNVAHYLDELSRPNLLINGDFQIWQRGTLFGTDKNNGYGADRWCHYFISASGNTITMSENGGISVNKIAPSEVQIAQYVEVNERLKKILLGKEVTLSVNITAEKDINDYEIRLGSQKPDSFTVKMGDQTITRTFKINQDDFDYTANKSALYCRILLTNLYVGKITVNWAKLELGSYATPFYPRCYEEELAICQKYYYKFGRQFETFANLYSYNNTLIFMIYKDFRKAPKVTVNGSIWVYALDKNENMEYINPTISCTDKGCCTAVGTSIPARESGLMQTGANSSIEFDAEIY